MPLTCGDVRGARVVRVEDTGAVDPSDAGACGGPLRTALGGAVRLVVARGGQLPCQAREDTVGVSSGHVVGGGRGGGVRGRLHPEALQVAAALRGRQRQPVGHFALHSVGGRVLHLRAAGARLAGQQGRRSAAVQVDRVVRPQVLHHQSEFGESDASGCRLPAVHGQHVHRRAVLGEAHRGTRCRRVVRSAFPVLRLSVHDEQAAAAHSGPRYGAAVVRTHVVLERDAVALLQRAEPLRTGVAADENGGALSDRSVAGLLGDRGDTATPQRDLGGLGVAVGGQCPIRLAPLGVVGPDAVLRHVGGVVRVQRLRAVGEGEGPVEVQVEDAARRLRADAERLAVAGGGGVRDAPVAYSGAERRARLVDVEEVRVQRGDGSPALARVVCLDLLGHRSAGGDLSGGEVVGTCAARAAAQLDAEGVRPQPLVGLQTLERGQPGAGRDRTARAGQLHAVAVRNPLAAGEGCGLAVEGDRGVVDGARGGGGSRCLTERQGRENGHCRKQWPCEDPTA